MICTSNRCEYNEIIWTFLKYVDKIRKITIYRKFIVDGKLVFHSHIRSFSDVIAFESLTNNNAANTMGGKAATVTG